MSNGNGPGSDGGAFPLGEVIVSDAAALALREARMSVENIIARHERGNSDGGAGDTQADDGVLSDHTRITSAFYLRTGQLVWVLTEPNRNATLVVLPDDF